MLKRLFVSRTNFPSGKVSDNCIADIQSDVDLTSLLVKAEKVSTRMVLIGSNDYPRNRAPGHLVDSHRASGEVVRFARF